MMADFGQDQFLVDPNTEVKTLQLEAKIQERVSRINRLKQDIDDLTKMAIKSKQAELKMFELELLKLRADLIRLKPEDAQIIDV
jgi:hypothetical protein